MASHGTQVSNPPSQHGVRQAKMSSEEAVDDDMRYLNIIRNQLLQVSMDNGKSLLAVP